MSTKQFTLPEQVREAWFFTRAGGEVYECNIVHASNLADEWVRLCWGSWENVPDGDFETLNQHISDQDNWYVTDGKPVCYELNFEDGGIEFHLIDRRNIVALLEANRVALKEPQP